MKIGKYKVDITHGDKILFPSLKLTKNDVLNFYLEISPKMLPHLRNRPLMLQRFPQGVGGPGFYQKDAPDYFPDWIETVEVKKEDGTVDHVLCNRKATLAYLCNQGTISFHTWLSKAARPNYPDKFIIDLDPPNDEFEQVRQGAFLVKRLLDELSLKSYVMTTGSSGLHVAVPLDGRHTFEESRGFGKAVGDILIDQHPDLFTFERLKEKRGDKIYFDIQRNAYAQTAVAPYSLRPKHNAPVATPLSWDELKDKHLHSRTYHIGNLPARLKELEDPWLGMQQHAVSVAGALRRLARLV